MKRIVIRDYTPIPPFGDAARDLRILNKPLWLLQRDILSRYCKGAYEVDSLAEAQQLSLEQEERFIHKNNLFFNAALINEFVTKARALKRACQIAFAADSADGQRKADRSISAHALRLQEGIRRQGDVYVADMYYYPAGVYDEPEPLIIDTNAYEMGYYHIPSYMALKGELVFQIPRRAFLSIEHWVHIYIANTPMGVFSWAGTLDGEMNRGRVKDFFRWTREDWVALWHKLGVVFTAFGEWLNPFEERWRNHFLASRKLVKVGKNCSIDPTAVIHGPTVIGDNVYIGPGTVISNSLIGNNVNVMQGSQVMLSVVSDRCFLPFNAGLFMTTLMDNSMVAQNSTLQLCVVGRNTFIGANNCFTDFNLLGEPIQVPYKDRLEDAGLPVLGSAVGHNCKVGSGFVVYPGRMIESNTVIIYHDDGGLISGSVAGGNPDDVDEVTGEPRRIVYRWPNVYNADGNESADANGISRNDGDHQHTALQISTRNATAIRAHYATLGGETGE